MEIDLELAPCEHGKLEACSDLDGEVGGEDANAVQHGEGCVNYPEIGEGDKEDREPNANLAFSGGQGHGDAGTVEADANKESTSEPCNGLEFESKEAAYSFYREYARSVGFGVTIKASRRSKKSGKFIDIKVVCSRFGSKRESCSPVANPRQCIKTGCKAGMQMKRKEDGIWVIHSFVKEHNHVIYPDDYIYTMGRKKKPPVVVACQKKGLQLALGFRDTQLMLDFFVRMKEENHNFFYAIDLDSEKRLKNVLWVDAKGRHEYRSFGDVVFFDTFYVKNKYKIPFVTIAGVNHHFQYILLGCALIGEESSASFSWLMRTWHKLVGGPAPRVVITDQEKILKEAVADVFPDARHCFCLWHVFGRFPENLGCEVNQKDFMGKFNKCVLRSWTDEQFEQKWQKMVDKFNLREDVWIRSLYEDRKSWVPTYMEGVFLAGMSTAERSESITSFLDSYICPETTFKEFIEQYKKILEDMYDMEENADLQTQQQLPGYRSLSSFEKQLSSFYTNAILKKFQVEVLGVASCHLQKEGENDSTVIFQVDDSNEHQKFVVAWKKEQVRVCCLCRSFEYRGILCRHALLVLEMSGVSAIPYHYILKRWTKNAKVSPTVTGIPRTLNSRFQRFNDLSKLATELGQVGSLSPETYHIALEALKEVLKSCIDVNDSVRGTSEPNQSSPVHGLVDEENRSVIMGKATQKSRTYKKMKGQSELDEVTTRTPNSVLQMEQSKTHNLNCYIRQHDIQGEFDSRAQVQAQAQAQAQAFDGYHSAQHVIPVAGQLSSISPILSSYYTPQQVIQGQFLSVPPHIVHQHGNQPSMQGLRQSGLRGTAVHGCSNLGDNLQDMDRQSIGALRYQNITSKRLHDKQPSQ